MSDKEHEKRERLDTLLVELGYFTAREKAKAAIMAGNIYVSGHRVDKAGTKISRDAKIDVKGKELAYVSRGGLKLEKAIKEFSLNFNGKVVLDIGSSTGGFVDCALQNGAQKVYAVDVGYGQLAWKLRNDERVIVLEKTNARYLTDNEIPEKVDYITVDASFISLEKVLKAPVLLLKEEGQLIALIKPQFEAGRDKVGKKGVVRDKKVHIEVIEAVIRSLESMELSVKALSFSPITGPEGNIEYLIRAVRNDEPSFGINVNDIVEEAWHNHSD